MSPITLLCADDHRLIRTGLVRVLELHKGVTVVAEASTGEEAVEQFARYRPDVTLMDLQMPKMNGLQAIVRIREIAPDARIIVLTMYEGNEDVYRALQAGAMGYLLKDAEPDDLFRVIQEVYEGRRAVSTDLDARVAAHSAQHPLTAREMQVIELLVRGMRNKEIGARLSISEETVRVHLKSIFVKFSVHDRTAALAEALRRGIVHVPSESP